MSAKGSLPLWKKALYALIILLGLLSFSEIVARMLAPDDVIRPDLDRLWAFEPETETTVEGVTFRVNELGIRDDPLSLPKPAGQRRVLCLGDSCTFGWQLPLEESFPKRLQACLGEGWRAINAGFPGYASRQILSFLAEDGLGWGPDAVVIHTGHNERTKSPLSDRGLVAELEGSPMAFLSRWSILVRVLGRARGSGRRPTVPRVSPEELEEDLRGAVHACGEIPVVLLYWDESPEVDRLLEEGESALAAGDPERAIDPLRRLWEMEVNWDPRGGELLARALAELGREEEAAEILAAADRLEEEHPWVREGGPYRAAVERVAETTVARLLSYAYLPPSFYIDAVHPSALFCERIGADLAGILSE